MFAAGLIVGSAAAGPSVPAALIMLAGLVAVIASLLAHRFLFWSARYRRNCTVIARRVRKPGP